MIRPVVRTSWSSVDGDDTLTRIPIWRFSSQFLQNRAGLFCEPGGVFRAVVVIDVNLGFRENASEIRHDFPDRLSS